MIILGLNTHHADSSAAIFIDGELVAATEEERFTRQKHWAGFPAKAIAFCLREANVDLENVDYITIGRDAKAKISKKVMFALKNLKKGQALLKNRWENRNDITSIPSQFSDAFGCKEAMIESKLVKVEHHRSHLASAFFASPFEEAAIISIDGSGDFTTCMFGYGKGNQIEVFDSIDYPVSLGFIYTAFTHFLGFPHYGDEYKVMGLAPYGKATQVEKVRKLIRLLPDGKWTWDHAFFGEVKVIYENCSPVVDKFFTKKFETLFGIS